MCMCLHNTYKFSITKKKNPNHSDEAKAISNLQNRVGVISGTMTWERQLFSSSWPQPPLPQLCACNIFSYIGR